MLMSDHLAWEAKVDALIARYRANPSEHDAIEHEARALGLQVGDIARWAGSVKRIMG